MAAKVGLAMDRGLVRAGERVCVAVSGGADSVALLVGLVEANAAGGGGRSKGNGGEALGVVLSAAHVHHGLRGAEADGDEAFVRELCGRLGVELRVFRVDTAARQAEEGEGLEEAARELRYGALRGLMEGGVVDVVATAHTLDDQAETVVMKMLRGAWTEGLGGISPEVQGLGIREQGLGVEVQGSGSRVQGPGEQGLGSRVQGPEGKEQGPGLRAQGSDNASFFRPSTLTSPLSTPPSGPWALDPGPCTSGPLGRVVRPLLGVRRAEVEAFLRARGQGWREDGSNRDLGLTRNRVRHVLMPVLREFNPGVDGLLARTAEVAREEEAFWRAEVERVLPQVLLPGKPVRGGGRAVSTAVATPAGKERPLGAPVWEVGYAMEIERLRAMPAALRRRVVRAAARRVFAEGVGGTRAVGDPGSQRRDPGHPDSLSGSGGSLTGHPDSLSGSGGSLTGHPDSLSGSGGSLTGHPDSMRGEHSLQDAGKPRRNVREAESLMVGGAYVLSGEETAKVLALAGFGGVGVAVTGRIGSRLELHGGLRVERSAREIRMWRQGQG